MFGPIQLVKVEAKKSRDNNTAEYVIEKLTVVVQMKSTSTQKWLYLQKKGVNNSAIALASSITDTSGNYVIKFDESASAPYANSKTFPSNTFIYAPKQSFSPFLNDVSAGTYELVVKTNNNANIDKTSVLSWCMIIQFRKLPRIVSTFFVDMSTATDNTYTHSCSPYSTLAVDENGSLLMNRTNSGDTNTDLHQFLNSSCPGLYHNNTIRACLKAISLFFVLFFFLLKKKNDSRALDPNTRYFYTCEFVVFDLNATSTSCHDLSSADTQASLNLLALSKGSQSDLPSEIYWSSPFYMQANQHMNWFPNQTFALKFIPWFMHSKINNVYFHTCISKNAVKSPSIYSGMVSTYFYGFDWKV
ncbi:hypothetical protein RFI_20096 [Reticulomyxa filosa]|uniref:Uncharacterized protein n=1 Tax=Reticulomyxa filosa TaxID=46433 RepID=X6MUU1_RETFI|nr:hypothetical protein RFI_20096 [Reticulomyxa filosa]|eukprot:ETO17232.1 hypothetical protein RFI_20096 [Reticulomyxa filosa]